jgi:hypothetical protein
MYVILFIGHILSILTRKIAHLMFANASLISKMTFSKFSILPVFSCFLTVTNTGPLARYLLTESSNRKQLQMLADP